MRRILFLLAVIVLLSACSENDRDLLSYIHQLKSNSYPFIDWLPQWSDLPSFEFPSHDVKANPFKPWIPKTGLQHSKVKATFKQFSLRKLKLVGVLKQGNKSWALIQQPNKSITRVQVGDYLGENAGLVKSIRDDMVQIKEKIRTTTGQWKNKTIRLR